MSLPEVSFRLVGPGDAGLLDAVAADVFDLPVRGALVAEFLADPRHHLAVALAGGQVVGFASAVHYVHPDKDADFWINEVGVAPAFQGRGVGKGVMRTILEHGRSLGCRVAWVLTEEANGAARALYRSSGGRESEVVMVEFDLA